MKIKVQKARINSIPTVIIWTTDWSKQELDNILRFDEPMVAIGGKFDKKPNGCPASDVPGVCGGCLSNQVRRFFGKPLEAMPEAGDTSHVLQQRLLNFKDAIEHESQPGPDLEDSSESGYCDEKDFFCLPVAYKKIRSEFPILMTFTEEHFQDPEKVGKLWADEIARRIAIEVKGLRYLGALFQKEEVYEI